jgi:hypothetical protein
MQLPIGMCKGQVYQLPTLQFFRQPRERISQATANVDESQLRRTWEEFEYDVDVCRVTNGAHAESLCINCMSFRTVFKLFSVFICNIFENALVFILTKQLYIATAMCTNTVISNIEKQICNLVVAILALSILQTNCADKDI